MLDVSRSDLVAAVAGAGTMGRGIVQVLAQCGARTLVYDAQPRAAAIAKDAIGQSLGKLAEKGRLKPAEVQATLGRIEVADSLQGFAPCHVVIEAIVEDLNEKRKIFSSLENVVAQTCILASNTSSLSVTAMAAACKRPGRVAGYHFFNPVPVLKIVEVVDGVRTEPWVTDALTALARRFGHTPVRCKDTPGFIVNHAGRAFVPESLRVLAEGVADFATIDRILVDAAGFRLGPFGLMDLVGLDVAHAVMKSMYQQYYEEPQDRPRLVRVRQGRRRRASRRAACAQGAAGLGLGGSRIEGALPTDRKRSFTSIRLFRSPAGKGCDDHRPRAWPRSSPNRRGRSAVRLCQAPHADDDARDPPRGARRRARPARGRRRAGVGDQGLAGLRRAARRGE